MNRIRGSIINQSIFSRRSNTIRAGCSKRTRRNSIVSSVVMYPLRRKKMSITRELRSFFYRATQRDNYVSFNGARVRNAIKRNIRRLIRETTDKRNKNCSSSSQVFLYRFCRYFPGRILMGQERITNVYLRTFSNFQVRLTQYVPSVKVLLNEFRSFSFCDIRVRCFQSLRVFSIPRSANCIFRVISVSEARMTSIRPFGSVLLLNNR